MTEEQFYTRLSGRGLIHVEGEERHEFLQNLITNDVNALEPGRALYGCLLTPQGKFLHDFFVSAGEDFLLLECEGGVRAQDLFRRLNMYRLRTDVQISMEESLPVYAVFGNSSGAGYPDPRDPDMGRRSFEKPQDLEEKPFEAWERRRILLGVPDGSRDMIPEKSTLLESNIDRLNGVSFKKGCFVGQELTARMHYRGLAKKHLYTVTASPLPNPPPAGGKGIEDNPFPQGSRAAPDSPFLSGGRASAKTPSPLGGRERVGGQNSGAQRKIVFLETLPPSGEDIRIEGKRIGEMRSSCGDIGLALLKDKAVDTLRTARSPCRT